LRIRNFAQLPLQAQSASASDSLQLVQQQHDQRMNLLTQSHEADRKAILQETEHNKVGSLRNVRFRVCDADLVCVMLISCL
jgi:hypothetical protein